jgi:GTP pyrophosphokinase
MATVQTPSGDALDELARERTPQQRVLLRDALEQASKLAEQLGDASLVDAGLAAATILAHLGLDTDTLVAALLRPSVGAAGESIIDTLDLPAPVARLLSGACRMDTISDLLGSDVTGRPAGHADQLRNLLVAMVEDVRVVLIKLAEELNRARGFRHLPRVECEAPARAALDIYAPLASRLGVRHLKWELEDLAFRALEPEVYADIARKLDERRVDRQAYIDRVISLLRAQLAENGVEANISGRPKHIHSIFRKMQAKSLGFDDVFDLRAVRILVHTVAECYTALGVVHTLWPHVPKEFDDYITNPKANRYQSLHTAVVGPEGKTLEVQIRTDEMHRHAEFGIAAHWRYKEGGPRRDPELEARIAWLRQLLEPGEDATGAELVEGLNAELLSDRVYVVTPRGDIVDLPAGSTPLDFAYHVHTDVGHRCRGAKVNGTIVPLTRALRSGDRVEVLTTRTPKPSRDWLNPHLGYLATARARAKVRHWLKAQDYEQHLADGQEVFTREVRRLGVDKPDREALSTRFNFVRFDDLLAALGRGEVSGAQLAGALQPSPAEPQFPTAEPERRRRRGPSEVPVSGAGGLLSVLAHCCKPVPPEPVVGFITRGRGLSVHRADCPNVLRLRTTEPERIMEVRWDASPGATYRVELALIAYDRHGLLKDISAVVSNEDLEIVALNLRVDERDGTAQVSMKVEVPDTERLGRLMDKLGQLANVFEVRRTG